MGGAEQLRLRDSQSHELLLCVVPMSQQDSGKVLAEIQEEFPDLEVHFFHRPFSTAPGKEVKVPEDLVQRATYLTTLQFLPATASAAPNLKFIQFTSAGINHVVKHPIYTDSKIPLLTTNGIHGPQISEWVIMMSLMHRHHFVRLYEGQLRKEWNPSVAAHVQDHAGKRVGILGYGSIGRQVARVAKAMGMDVIAYTASPRNTPESRRDGGFIVPGTGDPEGEFPSKWYSGTSKEDLHDFLRQKMDLLVVAVPLTKDTTHLLSGSEFALLDSVNPAATLVANIARGAIIDQTALIHALQTKQISGAAVDVTDPEPLPKDDPLWDAPNVFITPHVSASTTVYAERAFQVLRENIRRLRDGGKLVNEVDRRRGY